MKHPSPPLTEEDKELLRQKWNAGESKQHILAWLHHHGYSHTWGSVCSLGQKNEGWHERPDTYHWTEKMHAWLREHGQGGTDDSLAKRFNEEFKADVSPHSITVMRQNLGVFKRIPSSPTRRYVAPSIPEPVLFLPDLHIPYHDAAFINECCDVAQAWGIKHVVLDLDAIDLTWLQRFVRPRETPAPESEIRAWNDVTDALLERFKHIHIHAANHGARIPRLVQNMRQEERDLLRLVAKEPDPIRSIYIHRPEMEITDFWYVQIMKDWLIGHPNATGPHTALYWAETARKNTAVGHTHYRSVQWTRDDAYVAIEVGMCADPKKLPYVSQKLHARARGRQRQGALIIVRGEDGKSYPCHLTPHSNFAVLRRAYAA